MTTPNREILPAPLFHCFDKYIELIHIYKKTILCGVVEKIFIIDINSFQIIKIVKFDYDKSKNNGYNTNTIISKNGNSLFFISNANVQEYIIDNDTVKNHGMIPILYDQTIHVRSTLILDNANSVVLSKEVKCRRYKCNVLEIFSNNRIDTHVIPMDITHMKYGGASNLYLLGRTDNAVKLIKRNGIDHDIFVYVDVSGDDEFSDSDAEYDHTYSSFTPEEPKKPTSPSSLAPVMLTDEFKKIIKPLYLPPFNMSSDDMSAIVNRQKELEKKEKEDYEKKKEDYEKKKEEYERKKKEYDENEISDIDDEYESETETVINTESYDYFDLDLNIDEENSLVLVSYGRFLYACDIETLKLKYRIRKVIHVSKKYVYGISHVKFDRKHTPISRQYVILYSKANGKILKRYKNEHLNDFLNYESFITDDNIFLIAENDNWFCHVYDVKNGYKGKFYYIDFISKFIVGRYIFGIFTNTDQIQSILRYDITSFWINEQKLDFLKGVYSPDSSIYRFAINPFYYMYVMDEIVKFLLTLY